MADPGTSWSPPVRSRGAHALLLVAWLWAGAFAPPAEARSPRRTIRPLARPVIARPGALLSPRRRQPRRGRRQSLLMQRRRRMPRPHPARRDPRRVNPRSAPPLPLHRRVLLAIERDKGSVSLGNTSTGRLIRGARLAHRGKHHRVLSRWRRRGTSYATDELLTLLLDAAAKVARAHPGSRMVVGNLSKRGGGNIPWSRSHNAGRDGDIAFYLRRGRAQVLPRGLVKIDRHLRAHRQRRVRFDVERNWTLVAALLGHKTIQVQWIFVANHLKAALLRYARGAGATPALLSRADKVLRQPTDSLSHDDHFHVRIYCSLADSLQGCQDRPPFWPGVRRHDKAVSRRIRILQRALADPSPHYRLLALEQLLRLRARSAAQAVARRSLWDPDLRVRRAALGALLAWHSGDLPVVKAISRFLTRAGGGISNGGPPLDSAAGRAPDRLRSARQIRLAYDTVAATASPRYLPLLLRAIRSRRGISRARGLRPLPEAALAISASLSLPDLRLVPPLLSALEHPSGVVRRLAARSLRRLANHSMHLRWSSPMGRRRRRRAAARWRRWWRRNRGRSRESLVRRGFARLTRRLRALSTRRAQRILVSYTRRGDHLGYNAHRMLRVLSGERSHCPPGPCSIRHGCWVRWFRRRWRSRRRRQRMRHRRRRRHGRRRVTGIRSAHRWSWHQKSAPPRRRRAQK